MRSVVILVFPSAPPMISCFSLMIEAISITRPMNSIESSSSPTKVVLPNFLTALSISLSVDSASPSTATPSPEIRPSKSTNPSLAFLALMSNTPLGATSLAIPLASSASASRMISASFCASLSALPNSRCVSTILSNPSAERIASLIISTSMGAFPSNLAATHSKARQ